MSKAAEIGPVVIAGGSGFVGSSLARFLVQQGVPVTVLSRTPNARKTAWRFVRWDGRTTGPWQDSLVGARALINVTGRSVNCVKTPDRQDEILRSRVESTRVLGEALRNIQDPPPVWVQMSTAHIYGDPPSDVCDEDSSFGCGLAPQVARAWEDAFHSARLPRQRGVILRPSLVLGRDIGGGGGVLAILVRLTKFWLGGRVGSGMQGMSWIHEADLNQLFWRALTDSRMTGAYVASSPNPVPQHVFMRELRRVLHVPIGLPAAEWMVRYGACKYLRTDPELALYGRYVVSRRLAAERFPFQFPVLREALEDLLGMAGVAAVSTPATAGSMSSRDEEGRSTIAQELLIPAGAAVLHDGDSV
jgi:hypothetical protein